MTDLMTVQLGETGTEAGQENTTLSLELDQRHCTPAWSIPTSYMNRGPIMPCLLKDEHFYYIYVNHCGS